SRRLHSVEHHVVYVYERIHPTYHLFLLNHNVFLTLYDNALIKIGAKKQLHLALELIHIDGTNGCQFCTRKWIIKFWPKNSWSIQQFKLLFYFNPLLLFCNTWTITNISDTFTCQSINKG